MGWQPISRLAPEPPSAASEMPRWACASSRVKRARGASGAVVLMAARIGAALTAASVVAACSSGSHGSHAARRTGNLHTPAWLLTRSALSQLTAEPAARNLLQRAEVLEVLRPGQRPLVEVAAQPVVTFASAVALEETIRSGRLPPRTYGVLYDPEAWAFTPAAEQRDPARAATRAAAAAHADGLRLIVAPALNLTEVLSPRNGQPRWRRFLNLKLVARVARVADVIELQAQSLERSTATYAAFVRAATSQARAASASVKVFSGLSTNPPGVPVSSRRLTEAIQATRSKLEGYWLNIPGRGVRCPTCNAPRPQIAIQTLQALH